MFSFEYLKFEYANNMTSGEKRMYEHNVAYSLLDKMLKGMGITNYEFVKNENGKPFLKSLPIFFSITHTNGFCAVCTSDSPVGIDCEKIDESYSKKIEIFANRYFVENEISLLKNSEKPLFDFFKIWTTKEAYIKKFGLNGSYLKKIDTTKENTEIHVIDDYIISILK